MILHAEGRYGMGDSMSCLNIAHTKAWITDQPVELNFYWPHDRKFLYHFEDPESIVDRTDYIHNFYKDQNMVSVIHHFNTPVSKKLKEAQLMDDKRSLLWGKQKCTRTWFLDKDRLPSTIPNKLVFWRPTFNADEARSWKRGVNDEQWNMALEMMRENGYTAYELTYRTPIREALYHIASADLVIHYDGMWHYINTMLQKPTINVASSSIGMYNVYNGVMVRGWNDMHRLLHHWNKKWDYWDVKKHDPKTDGAVPVPRYQEYNMTGKEYVEKINWKTSYWLQLAYEKKKDWSEYSFMNVEKERLKFLGL